MQEKCKKIIEELFGLKVREKNNEFRYNINLLTGYDLYSLEKIKDYYDEILIKRSGTGLVVIIKF